MFVILSPLSLHNHYSHATLSTLSRKWWISKITTRG